MYTVIVPMYSQAVFSDVVADSPEAAIAQVLERIEESGIYDASDQIEEHMPLAQALKDDTECPKEPQATLIEDDEEVIE